MAPIRARCGASWRCGLPGSRGAANSSAWGGRVEVCWGEEGGAGVTHDFFFVLVAGYGCLGRYWTDFLANPQHVADLQAWGINFVRLGYM